MLHFYKVKISLQRNSALSILLTYEYWITAK